jgi:AcrR family transcriptional regulator
MTRPKTISDDELLAVARELFRAHGHAVSTRQVAEKAGISEGILYQRFGNKDDLFFAAMEPRAPDVEAVLGPEDPTEPAEDYLPAVVVRLGEYFGEVLPLALRLITHPSFDRHSLGRAQLSSASLQQGLVRRLAAFEARKQLRKGTAEPTAQLLVSLAHDWALGNVMSQRATKRTHELVAMVDLAWKGARPKTK